MSFRIEFVVAGFMAITFYGLVRAEVIIETVTVGNPGNPGDARYPDPPVVSFGGVDYAYNIGKFEVTAGQYAEFLNAVAGDDTYELYNTNMWISTYGCKIERTDSSPNYSYSVAADWADRPVNIVSWGDAARFANWLHNGQPTGAQDLGTTEDGSYFLNGATSDAALREIARAENATWVIPSEDEWYKAAYHKNDGVTGHYYDYPTSSDSVPGYVNDSGELSGMSTVFMEGGTDPGNYATYEGDTGIQGVGDPYFRTVVGEWENSESPYGMFDQAGNVWEWNETAISEKFPHFRGGSFRFSGGYMLAATRTLGVNPTDRDDNVGFRVASVELSPVPTVSTWGLAVFALSVMVAGTVAIRRL